MIGILLALLPFVAQQPSAGALVRPRPTTVPRTRYDSTVAAVRDIGNQVARVKSDLDLFHRATAARPSGEVIQRASGLRSSCDAMASAIQRGLPMLCRGCLARSMQTSIDRYRAYLPALARVGRQCAARIRQLTRSGAEDAQAGALKREANALSARVVGGIVPYEQRLAAVRRAFGWAPASPAPRRGP